MPLDQLDPTCANCGQPASWHSAIDNACPDDDSPHPDSETYDIGTQDGRFPTAAERIRAAREARGDADPLNRLRARNADAIAAGAEPIVEQLEEQREDLVTCGACCLTWNDAIPTSWTPAPSARCPFEYQHHEDGTPTHPDEIPADFPVRPVDHDPRAISPAAIAERLEKLRAELRAERISYGELAELADLAEHIEPGDVELLEAAGIPEHSGSRRAEILEQEAPELAATPAGRMASTIAADPSSRRFYDTAKGSRCNPAAVAAIARAVDRDYGETGYVLTIVGGNAAGAIARVEHFDGSRFLLVADRFENVERVPDLEPAELAYDDEPAGAGTDPRPDPRTHPEAWTE